MTNFHSIQTVLDETGRPVSVIVPIELWRQIAPDSSTSTDNSSTSTDAPTRAQIWRELRGSMPQLTPTEELMAEKHAETEREEEKLNARF